AQGGAAQSGAARGGAARAAASGATLTLLAKGIQCPPLVLLNGVPLERRLKLSPRDGSFGAQRVPVPAGMLQPGDNRLEIRAMTCYGDLDDFEFVNVQVHVGEAE
ncbi:MAG: hypothetical protein AB1716_18480, partial [Planctomycetota bacterium]